MKLASDINPTLKQFYEETREPGESFCRRCGVPQYITATLRPYTLAGKELHLCGKCQEAVLDAVWPTWRDRASLKEAGVAQR